VRGFFTIFYVDDAYFASWDPVFLQTALDVLVELFERVGLETNRLKMQAMICTPGRIRTQLPTASYHRMRLGFQSSEEWEARRVTCSHCNASMQAHSLPHHLATLHGVYQQTVVVGELLDEHASVTYTAEQRYDGKLPCPVVGCLGVLKGGWNMRRHFRDLHFRDKVIVKKKGRRYPRCTYCGMQMDPTVCGHWRTESSSIGAERRIQREAAVTLVLALQCTVTVHGDVLEQVEVFKYLGRLLAQDDDNVQAVRQQIRKARGTWKSVGQVL